MSRRAALLLVLLTFAGVRRAAGERIEIGIIDFYGLGRLSETTVRQTLTFKEGDTISLDGADRLAPLTESERRLSTLPGVTRARAHLVCCEAGRGIVYVGIEARGRATRFRPAPGGNARLAADVVRAGHEFSEALMAAVRRGDAVEDDSQGHALQRDPAARAVQERFVGYAARDLSELRRVLRTSSDADERALAAEVLGYAADKQAVVDDLMYAMSDSVANVRNNAMRTLAVFARATPAAGRPVVRVPYEPFIALLLSPVWTDRNKASWALMALSERRDPTLLAQLQHKAMEALVDMARWKSHGHAIAALLILARIAGLPDETANASSTRSERETIINAALKRR